MAVEDLEPALWGTLPKELLHFVFQHLPAAQISEIHLLSKAWNSSIDSRDSYFSRLLEETVYPHMFGLVSKDSDDWCVKVFDAKADRWHIQEIVPSDDYAITVGAADGGLVCFVSVSTEDPLAVVVMNPLTGKKTQLPPLLSIYNVLPTIQPSMVQLTMDRQTNQYQVLVVGYIQSGNRGLFAQLYDSQSKQWSVVGSVVWGFPSGSGDPNQGNAAKPQANLAEITINASGQDFYDLSNVVSAITDQCLRIQREFS